MALVLSHHTIGQCERKTWRSCNNIQIHATSAALIDGMKGMLMSSDFETAMKMLTSWIPVKDEELLMKVAKTEWKMRRRRKPLGGVGGTTGRASGAVGPSGASQHTMTPVGSLRAKV